MGVQFMDEQQIVAFASTCLSTNTQFCGGVFTISAVAEQKTTGAETYYTITPSDTRRNLAYFTTTRWLTGFVPIKIPATGSSFRKIHRCR